MSGKFKRLTFIFVVAALIFISHKDNLNSDLFVHASGINASMPDIKIHFNRGRDYFDKNQDVHIKSILQTVGSFDIKSDVSANDSTDGDITSSIVITKPDGTVVTNYNIDTNVLGEHRFIYSVTNSSNKTKVLTRLIKIVENKKYKYQVRYYIENDELTDIKVESEAFLGQIITVSTRDVSGRGGYFYTSMPEDLRMDSYNYHPVLHLLVTNNENRNIFKIYYTRDREGKLYYDVRYYKDDILVDQERKYVTDEDGYFDSKGEYFGYAVKSVADKNYENYRLDTTKSTNVSSSNPFEVNTKNYTIDRYYVSSLPTPTTPEKVEVLFETTSNGYFTNSSYNKFIVNKGEVLSQVPTPIANPRFMFDGWTQDGINVINLSNYPINQNTRFIAKYTAVDGYEISKKPTLYPANENHTSISGYMVGVTTPSSTRVVLNIKKPSDNAFIPISSDRIVVNSDGTFTFNSGKLPANTIINAQLIESGKRISEQAVVYVSKVYDETPRTVIRYDGDTNIVRRETVQKTVKETIDFKKSLRVAYMKGYPDNTFKPDRFLSRAEASTLFARLLDASLKANLGVGIGSLNLFVDVNPNDWFAPNVILMKKNNIMLGYPDNTFKPNRFMTRAEFVTTALRFNKDEIKTKVDNVYSDVPSSHWASKAINGAYSLNWLRETKGFLFKPDDGITRASAVNIINKMLDRKDDEKDINIKHNVQLEFLDVPYYHWAYKDIMESSTSTSVLKVNNK